MNYRQNTHIITKNEPRLARSREERGESTARYPLQKKFCARYPTKKWFYLLWIGFYLLWIGMGSKGVKSVACGMGRLGPWGSWDLGGSGACGPGGLEAWGPGGHGAPEETNSPIPSTS